MVRMQRLTAIVSTGLMVGALLACKKKPEAAPEASATPPAPVAPATTPAAAATPAPTPEPATPPPVTAKLGDPKRYGVEKESKLDEAGVRVALDEVKVYNEADTKTAEVATLPKGLLVFRLVKMDDFQLVEFPSGIGQFSKGWVETKGLTDKPEKVSRDAALSEKKTANVKPVDGGVAPSPSGSAAPKPSASVAPTPPKPSATVAPTAAPKPPAPPKPGVKKKPEEKK
jgi:hypothetical protein